MARFGRSRANTDDSSNFQYTTASEGTSASSEPVSGFAASAAAGGVASTMGGRSVTSGGTGAMSGGATSGASGAVSGSSGGGGGRRGGHHRKQKSITSGISTLFRRQPSPDFDEGALYGGGRGGRGGRDPAGVHATRSVTTSRGVSDASSSAWETIGDSTATSSGMSGGANARIAMAAAKKAKSQRPNSRGGRRSRTATPQQQAQQMPAAQSYSQTQRDLLHSGAAPGAYDHQAAADRAAQDQQEHEEQLIKMHEQSQRQGQGGGGNRGGQGRPEIEQEPRVSISQSMSGMDGSGLYSGTSLSQEMSEHNYNDRNNGRRRRDLLSNPSMSHDQSNEESTLDETLDETFDTADITADGTAGSGTITKDRSDSDSERGEDETLDGTVDSRDSSLAVARDRRRRQRDREDRKRKGRLAATRQQLRLPRRYRGFSTSVSSLFLDESIVCGALSCCGLLLSARTEHLLNERNAKRGLTRRGVGGAAGGAMLGARRAPSHILSVAWAVTVLGVLVTYAVWGFGDQSIEEYQEWYDYDDYYFEGQVEDNGVDDGGVANDDENQNQLDDGIQNQANDDWKNQANDDRQNQANDDWQNQANDDGNNDDWYQNWNQVDDGNANIDDGNVNNDDGDADADDGNVNNADDANAASDDGNAGNDDDNVPNDDGADADDGSYNYYAYDDVGNVDDAEAYYQDDYYANRKLIEAIELTRSQDKHSFNGVMKLREHREHIFELEVRVFSRVYLDLMAQFEEHSPSSVADLDRRLMRRPGGRHLEEGYEYDDDYYAESSFNQGHQVRAVLVVLFLFLLGVIGRRRRMRTRFAILRSRAQDDHLYYAHLLTKGGAGASGSLATPDNTVMENFHEREDKYDGACSHTLFGCYPADSQLPDYADYGDSDGEDLSESDGERAGTGRSNASKRKRRGGDFVARTFSVLLGCCCGRLCQCWCQLFSICALAQEAREARLLLPPSAQRIDMITHQPFHEYARDVNTVRRRFMERANRTWLQHYAALSHLSRGIILGFVLIVAFVVTTMLVHPMGGFNWGDALVLIATFTQSFLVLVVVFGIFHRSDLSFDAVVKFFAVGFIICVPVGFVLEGMLMNGLISLVWVGYYLCHWLVGEDFDVFMVENHRLIWMLGELVNAYFVAALVEEMCKYYGFRFVEHPDLLFLTGLDRSARQAGHSGGMDSYNYDSHLVSDFSRNSDSDTESVDSRGRRKRNNCRKTHRDRILQEIVDEEPELRTLQQQAAAITTGMISVAVGLACAENFLYVFFLGGTAGDIGKVSGELAILLFRSIFPVHALSAAMQGVNMIRKFIEEKHDTMRNIGVGKIIFPAVLLHGTFDAILMCVNAYIESSWDNYDNNSGGAALEEWEAPYNVLVVNLTAFLGIVGVMAVSFGWFSYQNKLQMLRLAKLEMKNKVRSERSGFNAPNLV